MPWLLELSQLLINLSYNLDLFYDWDILLFRLICSGFLQFYSCSYRFLLFRHILRLSRLLHKLEDSVCSQRRLIPEESRETLRKIGALGLVDSINELIDSNNQSIIQKNDYSEQFDVILGAVQEAVIVFNEDHVVEYANRSTERIFHEGLPIQGMSLEGVFRSSALLEHLDSAATQVDNEPTRMKINLGKKKLWFEVSCSKVQGMHSEGTYSTLLVMHDITKQKDLEASRRKFVANASHELRTPLTIIKGFAETLTDDKAGIDSKMRDRFTKKILKKRGAPSPARRGFVNDFKIRVAALPNRAGRAVH